MNFYEGLKFAAFRSEPVNHQIWRHEPFYYGLQYNHSGRFFLRIDHGTEFRGEGPCAFITHPGAFFEYGYCDDFPRHHNHLCVCGGRVEKYLESGLLVINDSAPIIQVKQPNRFLNVMLGIIVMLQKNIPNIPPRAVLMFEDLLLQLFHDPIFEVQTVPSYQHDFFTHLIAEIRAKPENDWCFEEISRKHGQTFHHFRRLFKNLAGLPPQQFLIQCRLQLAASMLVGGSDPIKLIARNTGFNSNIYFYRLFKQYFKVTPLEYRGEFASFSSPHSRSRQERP